MSDLVGKKILHYKIIEKLGQGGMGVVYLADDTKLNRQVAIKFLPNHISKNSDERKRFEIEAQAAASLNHPNIATIYSIEEAGDKLFIVMEYIKGNNLKDHINSKPFEFNEAIDIALQAVSGLQEAHNNGVIHRDIKTANIMINDKGVVKIMDFGLAKVGAGVQLTKEQSTLGTAAYMSPEQARGQEVDHRSDIWSFGVVLYEMLTGTLPFKGDYEQAIVYGILNEEPEPITTIKSDLPLELERIINKMLSKKINARYSGDEDLIVDLQKVSKEMKFGIKTSASKDNKITSNIKFILGGIIFIILCAIVVFLLNPQSDNGHLIKSIAVLPLDNFSHDPEQEYFVDGMTEALITELSKIQSLTVISRTSVMQFKETKKTLPQIAKELNVDAIIEGSALLINDKVRITAQLIDAFDKHRWAEIYDRDLKDVFTIHQEVALDIAREVQKNITSQDKTFSPNQYPKNSEVYQLYLKGRYFLNLYTYDSHKKAVQYFEQVINLDPDYALGYAGLADVYGIWSALELPRTVSITKSKEYVMKALELDESLAEAHTTLGSIKWNYDWDWEGAEKELRRAVELNPNYAFGYHILSHYLLLMGQNDESFEVSKRALELAPLDMEMNIHLGFHYYLTREFDKAKEQYIKSLEINPYYPWAHSWLGRVYKEMGWYSKAIEEFKQALSLIGKNEAEFLSNLGNVYAVSGNSEKALEIINELIDQAKQKYVPSKLIAVVYVGLGEKDKSFEWLEKAFQERDIEIDSPLLDPICKDPRFINILHRMNYPLNN